VATAPYAVVEHSVSHVWCTGTLRIWISLGSYAASWAASCPASPRSSSGRRPGRSSTLRVVPWEMLEPLSAAHPVWTARLRLRYKNNSQRQSSEMESQNIFTFVIFQYAGFGPVAFNLCIHVQLCTFISLNCLWTTKSVKIRKLISSALNRNS